MTPFCSHAKPTPIPLSRGATGGRPRRSGTRRTLRASVLHPTLPGRLRAPTRRALRPASEQLRFGRSYVGDGPGSASWDSWATRTRKNAAVERREASTLRNWVLDASLGVQACRVKARQGAGDPAPSACRRSTPLVFEGTEKEASPARFAVTDRSTGPAERCRCASSAPRSRAPGRRHRRRDDAAPRKRWLCSDG